MEGGMEQQRQQQQQPYTRGYSYSFLRLPLMYDFISNRLYRGKYNGSFYLNMT